MNIEDVKNKNLYVILRKNKPCCDCNQKFHYSSMQFDHIKESGEKLFEIGNGKQTSHSLEEIKEEIKKCDLVCANCHFKRTFLRKLSEISLNNLPENLTDLTDEDIIKYYKSIKNEQNKKLRDKKKILKTMGEKYDT